jgi:NTP pyrophosphatase (non-canonical NTP hydrolase)
MKELQDLVREFVDKYNLRKEHGFLTNVTFEELGELSKEIRLSTGYGIREFTSTKEIHGELGDVLMNLIRLANECEVDMEEALKDTMKKMAERIELKGHPGSRQ